MYKLLFFYGVDLPRLRTQEEGPGAARVILGLFIKHYFPSGFPYPET
jgi:hypothetical protein